MRLCETHDGTFTLQHPLSGEAMHNVAGAISETLHVYGPAARRVLSLEEMPIQCLSVGLGLGCVEMMLVAFALKACRQQYLRIVTFEAEEELSTTFRQWASGTASCHPVHEAREKNLVHTAEAIGVEAARVKATLNDLLIRGCLRLEGRLTAAADAQGVDAIFYDPYSAQTDADMWNEAFLDGILQKWAKPRCVFSTYAARSSLHRSLAKSGFTNLHRKGFGPKREMTLASRGWTTDAFGP
jgi:hypothetical protein